MLVLLSGENTSQYKKVITAPFTAIQPLVSLFCIAMNLRGSFRLPLGCSRADWTRTVATRPATTIARLNDCCVVRATFSRAVNCAQGTRPSSLITVTFLRGDAVEDELGIFETLFMPELVSL